MGGEAPDRPALDPGSDARRVAAERRRRIAMVRLAVGGPMFMVLVFGLVIAYRVARRPLGDPVFWAVLVTLVVGFGLYAGSALLVLRRARR